MRDPEQPEETVTTRVSQKGQTTIPKEIRERLGIEPAGSGREAVRTLLDGPVDVANLDRSVFFRLDNLYDVYTMHDAILVAAHKSRQTDGILTNDEQIRTYDGDAVVWE